MTAFRYARIATIFDHCRQAHVSCGYYYGNVPFLALFPIDALLYSHSFSTFLSDCAKGSLPTVSFVDPSFTLLLNTANDNHPESDIRNGDAFMAEVYNAVATSPEWDSTVLVLNYDEWGGFFDHVPPPRALAPNNTDTDLVNGKALLGCRVPCIVASPWTVNQTPSNPSVVHTCLRSHLGAKMIESVFGVKPLAARETSGDTGNLLSVIDFSNSPKAAPVLPRPQPVTPQTICASSIGPLIRNDDEHNSFRKLHQAAQDRGWPVFE